MLVHFCFLQDAARVIMPGLQVTETRKCISPVAKGRDSHLLCQMKRWKQEKDRQPEISHPLEEEGLSLVSSPRERAMTLKPHSN